MKNNRKTKFRNSLLSRYLIIIGIALIFVPILIPLSYLASWAVNQLVFNVPGENKESVRSYGSGINLEEAWHREALALGGKSPEEIDAKIQALQLKYPDAAMFWVDGTGVTRLQLPEQRTVPDKWSPADAISYMKRAVNSDPFTIVAFIGAEENSAGQGFMVFELPRKHMNHTTRERKEDFRFFGFIMFVIFAFFILLSYLFFRGIQKRLQGLESGMTRTGRNGLPIRIPVGRPDEIGRLEQTFNHMVDKLDDSRRRELKEEELRKSLISNLSHDLRTPLTVLASQLYSFRKEPLSEQGRESLSLMETKIDDLSGLIDHLLSYNLLASGRYALNLEDRDIYPVVRLSAAAWYPLWEKAGLEADIDLPEDPLVWRIDEQGFRRVLDNLFQNVVRHAGTGGYVGISVTMRNQKTALVIKDHGPGIDATSPAQGARLGLQIVDLLLREMDLVRETESTPEGGTRNYIYPT